MNHWFAEHYGSRGGFVLTWWHWLRYRLGSYRDYQQVDWKSVGRLVFVCKGNICRSAYAEAVARSLGLESISCGIDTTQGAAANGQAIRTAALKDIDLKTHKTTPLQSVSLKKSDLLVAMEPWQVAHLKRQLGKECRCTLLGLWGQAVYPHIHDPFGSSAAYFSNCFNYIEKSVHEIAKKIS